MKKYVKCIDNARGQYNLTIGKIYEVTSEPQFNLYYVVNDCGYELNYHANIFEIVGCPCSIKDCIKHRVKQ